MTREEERRKVLDLVRKELGIGSVLEALLVAFFEDSPESVVQLGLERDFDDLKAEVDALGKRLDRALNRDLDLTGKGLWGGPASRTIGSSERSSGINMQSVAGVQVGVDVAKSTVLDTERPRVAGEPILFVQSSAMTAAIHREQQALEDSYCSRAKQEGFLELGKVSLVMQLTMEAALEQLYRYAGWSGHLHSSNMYTPVNKINVPLDALERAFPAKFG